MSSIRDIVEESDTQLGKCFDICIQSLIVVSIVTFSIETMPNLSPTAGQILHAFEVACVTVFTIEYLLRVMVADGKIGFVLSFFGLIDLLAILPFYIGLGVDLRSLRAFRLLRLVRILKLARYSEAMQRFHTALLIAKEEVILFLFTAGMLLYLAAVGIYYFEHEVQPDKFGSVFHSLWWAVATLTTVGYGDAVPLTIGGRVFTFAVLIVGLGVVSVPAGLVASALSKARQLERNSAEKGIDC